jgi:hypothetical protein
VSAWRDRMRHAFAVDPPGPAEPAPQEAEAVERFCRFFVRRHLSLPGVVFMEMCRPLNYVTSQAMHFCSPGIWAIARQQNYEQYGHFAAFLGRRGSIEYLVRRIEQLEQERKQGPQP